MVPLADSMMRNNASVSDDFPAPVRPTIPICKDKLQFTLDGNDTVRGRSVNS